MYLFCDNEDKTTKTGYRENRDSQYTETRGSLTTPTYRYNRHKEKEPHGQRKREASGES